LSTPSFLIALIAIFVAAKVFGEIAERLGQPAVLGELIGGVAIGVSGLHLVDPHDVTIHLLSELGVILLLFVIGLETDLKKLMQVGGSATAVAVVGVALPLLGGFAFGELLGLSAMVSLFLGASLTATSVGITARVLSDLGHLQDDASQIILGAAVVDDIIGLVLLTIVGTLAEGGKLTVLGIGKIVLIAFGFVLLAIVIGSQLAPMLIRAIDRIKVARGLLFASIVFALTLAYLAQRVGSAIIIGSFAAGLVLARTHRGKDIAREVHDVSQFFVPIFFVVVGAAIDFRTINWMGFALAAIGIAGKVLAGFVVWRKGVNRMVVGVGMIPRGEVGLIFAQIGLSTRLLSAQLYSAVAVMITLTTFVAPPLLRRLLAQEMPGELESGSADIVMDAPMDQSAERGVQSAEETP
jgi:Kef-type K+ transport system membrane component KefB